MHADDASININLWITPDESCKNLENSGLKLYPVAVPKDASFSDYNNDQNQLNRFISGEKEKKQLEVPYRCNRAVIFKSRIIHQTSEYEFYSGYENRRVNITFLFD